MVKILDNLSDLKPEEVTEDTSSIEKLPPPALPKSARGKKKPPADQPTEKKTCSKALLATYEPRQTTRLLAESQERL